jgi:hypothetical protein
VDTLKSYGRQSPIFQESYIEKNGVAQCVRKLSLWKFREHIVPRFDDGVACGAAFGIVILRWLVGSIGQPKTVGSSLILESAISPSTSSMRFDSESSARVIFPCHKNHFTRPSSRKVSSFGLPASALLAALSAGAHAQVTCQTNGNTPTGTYRAGRAGDARRISSCRSVFTDDFAKRCHRLSIRPRVRDELALS